MTGLPKVIAHRGASVAAPENTVQAFLLAARLGADGVELDARRTADGATVVHHDAVLPDARTIVDLVAADLPPSVPTLTEALDACGELDVNIEIKNLIVDPDHDPGEAVASAVVDEIGRRRHPSRYLVSSFNMNSIDRVRRLDRTIETALLVHTIDDLERVLERTRHHGHGALNPWDGLVNADLVARAHTVGLRVNVWTVDEPGRLAELAALGVDGIVTNVPDVAVRVLHQLG